MVEALHQKADFNLLQFMMKIKQTDNIFNLKHCQTQTNCNNVYKDAEDTNPDLGPIRFFFHVLLPQDHSAKLHLKRDSM